MWLQDAATTLAIFSEVGGSKKEKAIESPNFFLQFITRYLHAEGTLRTRVTTITRRFATQNSGIVMLRVLSSHLCSGDVHSICMEVLRVTTGVPVQKSMLPTLP